MILFYASDHNRVVEIMDPMLSNLQVKRFRSFKALAKRLRQPHCDLDIGLIAVHNAEEMAQINQVQDLLRDLRLVVILPWRDPDIIAWAHKLAPRFIGYADNGFEQVGAVLAKMVRLVRKGPRAQSK